MYTAIRNRLCMANTRPKTKTEAISLRLSPQVKAAAELAAQREHRTLTNFIEFLILTHCETHNITLPAAVPKENRE